MKSYISGSSGFIGSHLGQRLASSTPIFHKDIQKTRLEPFEKMFFLSSYGNMAHHINEAEIYKANITDLLSILMQIKDMSFKSFVYISSSSVTLPVQTTYSRCKRAAEEILLALIEKYDLPITIIRPTSVYGPYEQPTHLIPTIIKSCLTGDKMDFVRAPIHDFIYIDDLLDGIMTLSENQAKGIYTLGTGIKTSNQQVLDTVEELMGKKANVNVTLLTRKYDNQDWVSTDTKARDKYGWRPNYSLRKGLEMEVLAYEKHNAR